MFTVLLRPTPLTPAPLLESRTSQTPWGGGYISNIRVTVPPSLPPSLSGLYQEEDRLSEAVELCQPEAIPPDQGQDPEPIIPLRGPAPGGPLSAQPCQREAAPHRGLCVRTGRGPGEGGWESGG